MKTSFLWALLAGIFTAYIIGTFIILTSPTSTVDLSTNNFKPGVGGAPPPVSNTQDKTNGTILDTLNRDGNFVIFLEALKETGLSDKLSGSDQYTLFAPTDEAFSRIPQDSLYALFNDRNALRAVLAYHIVSGLLSENSLKSGKIQSLEGAKLNINTDGQLSVNSVTITKADIKASNGVIQVINEVLVPPNYLLSKPISI